MKQFLLLLDKFTYLPVPKKLVADSDQLPRALRLLPLLGLFCGGLVYLVSRLLMVMPPSGAAATLLGVYILLGGAQLLRDLITVADGLAVGPMFTPRQQGNLATAAAPSVNTREVMEKERRFNAGRSGLIWGIVWLIGLYFLYLWYFSSGEVSGFAFVTAPVVGRWLMSWIIYYFYAAPPAWLHRNFGRHDFVVCSALALLAVLPFSSPVLYISVLVSFLGIYLFATFRQRAAGALDDACYGAAAAWAEILFLLGWMTFYRFL
jgi:cobalamin synthase